MALVLNDLDFNSVSRVKNLPAPQAASDAVRLQDLNSAIEGLAWKDSARVASTATVNLSSPGSSIDGISLSNGDRLLLKDQTTASQNGIYIFNGAATPLTRSLDASTAAELEAATLSIEEGTQAGTCWRQTAVNFVLDTDPVTFVAFGTAAPSASTTTPGLIAIATQSEVDAGSVTNEAVVPSTLNNWSGRKLKATATIGDGSSTQYDVTHNFNTRDVDVAVYRNSTPWDTVFVDVERPSVNAVRLRFASAPASNSYQVVVLG